MSTRTEIIATVNKKTENALDALDAASLFNEVLQEFCSEHRFWWRKKRFTFPTVGGTATYDLSDTSTVVTTPASIGPFVEEITYMGRVDGTDISKIDPIFDEETIAGWTVSTTQDKPTCFTVDSNDTQKFQVVRLNPIPNGVYTVHVSAWMMPNPSTDSSDDAIYIVPSIWHHVLQTALERETWRLKYGAQDAKFVTAAELYKKKVAAAKVQPSFSSERIQTWNRTDGRAIRSTR